MHSAWLIHVDYHSLGPWTSQVSTHPHLPEDVKTDGEISFWRRGKQGLPPRFRDLHQISCPGGIFSYHTNSL